MVLRRLFLAFISPIAAIASILLIRYSILVIISIRKYAKIPGPEPKGFAGFILGYIPQIIEENSKGISLPLALSNLFKKYGSTFKYRLFSMTYVYTINPRIIKQVLVDDNFQKFPRSYKTLGFPGGERFMGNGLVTILDDQKWRRRRSLFDPSFHQQALMTFMKVFNEKGNIFVKFLETKANGKTQLTLIELFNHAALDIIANVGFSLKLDTINNPKDRFNKNVFEALDGLKYFFQDRLIKFKPHRWPFIMNWRRIVRELRKIGRDQIEARLKMIKNNQELPNDILTIIIESFNKENEKFNVEEMVDDFITFFIAGQETMATLLASLFLELGKNRECLQKARNEVDSVLGTNNEIKFENLSELQYISCCIKESLRISPPITQIPRFSNKEIKTEDFLIPKNSLIYVSIFGFGRSESYYEEPLKFKPERFMNVDSKNEINNFMHLPFSLGPRNCVGQNFAQIEATVLIAKFLQKFDFTLDPNQSFVYAQEGTFRPKDGTKCFITSR